MALTTLGKARIAALLNGEAVDPFNTANCFVGVGNGTDAFDAADTDLQGASKHRVAADLVTRSGAVLTITATFPAPDANFAWDELGLFDDAAAGTMLAREVVAMGTKASGIWTLTITATVG